MEAIEVVRKIIGERREAIKNPERTLGMMIVEVKKEGNEIMLRYRESEIRTIAGLCQRG